MGTQIEILARKELYDLVWSSPMLSLSKKYVISDTGLRKICKRMNIPLPKTGHWMKLKFGKKARMVPLPVSDGKETQVTLTIREGDEETDHTILTRLTNEIENDPRLSFVVPDKLTRPDELIQQAKQLLTRKELFEPYTYKGVVDSHRGGLDIRVGHVNVNRALLFMDTFIKALRARGHEINFRNYDTYACVNGHDFRICCREKMKIVVVEKPWKRNWYHPTNIFFFRIDGYRGREWKDGKHPLENRIPEIIAKLELMAAEMTRIHEDNQRQWDEQAEKERLIKEKKEHKEKELVDFKELLNASSRWQKAANLRQYIAEVEHRAENPESIKEWLEWARRKADWYDPFTETEDQLLDSVDRNSLAFKMNGADHSLR